MVPLNPDIADAEKILKKYEPILKSIPGVMSVGLGGNVESGIYISAIVRNKEVGALLEKIVVAHVEGLDVRFNPPGRGALNPAYRKRNNP